MRFFTAMDGTLINPYNVAYVYVDESCIPQTNLVFFMAGTHAALIQFPTKEDALRELDRFKEYCGVF